MKLIANVATLVALMAATSLSLTSAILVQPYNYMLDDSAMISQPDGGSLSPFYNDQSGGNEQSADKDIISIIGDKLARLKYARMLDNQEESVQHQNHFSQEMADLIQSEQQVANNKQDGQQDQSLSSSVANMLLNVAQAAAHASEPISEESQQNEGPRSNSESAPVSSRGSIMELDTSSPSASASALPNKADLKSERPIQWFNPKETIPVLKISSMATPSKYKKVYFRSEKKLVDGAFHSPTSEQDEKKSLLKTFNSGVQRRSSRGTSSSVAPPSFFQDGVIDFLKKFRDVYIQTRPVSASGSSASSLASSVVSAAASSPLAAVLAPSSSSGSRPNFASALSAASNMVNNAAMVAQAASSSSSTSSAATGASSPIKSPLTAQSYVSFWSKTFPTWVRKMLKQLRRRSLYNSSKRQQHNHQHSAASAIGQAAQAAASSVVEQAANGGSSSSSSQSSSH